MPLSESLEQTAIRELSATACGHCGQAKMKGRSFCLRCYRALPQQMQWNLWVSMSMGYASKHDEARDWLKINRPVQSKV